MEEEEDEKEAEEEEAEEAEEIEIEEAEIVVRKRRLSRSSEDFVFSVFECC